MKMSKSKPKNVTKWYFPNDPLKAVKVVLRVKVVGQNTYYFLGKKQITQPVYNSKFEAITAKIGQNGESRQSIMRQHDILLNDLEVLIRELLTISK